MKIRQSALIYMLRISCSLCAHMISYSQIVKDMWIRDPIKRPSAKEVVRRLEVLLEELKYTASVQIA